MPRRPLRRATKNAANPKQASREIAAQIAASRSRDVSIEDSPQELIARAEGERQYYWLDIHLTPAGNASVAAAVAPELQALIDRGLPVKSDALYTTGSYLERHPTWHAEDSAWKAQRIADILERNGMRPDRVAEVGCGAGGVLRALSEKSGLVAALFEGYDISPQAIEIATKFRNDRLEFRVGDPFSAAQERRFDLLLAIDVFEHVSDYMGFLRRCRTAAEFKVYHIPLDIHVSSVLRNSLLQTRRSVGHLHYFTADSALASLSDTGHEILDWHYTNAALDCFGQRPSLKRALANVPRWLIARASVAFAARLLGGFSLLVLAK